MENEEGAGSKKMVLEKKLGREKVGATPYPSIYNVFFI